MIDEVYIKRVSNGYVITEVRPPAERSEQWVCESIASLEEWIEDEFSLHSKEDEDDN